jgi:hypothetical protein
MMNEWTTMERNEIGMYQYLMQRQRQIPLSIVFGRQEFTLGQRQKVLWNHIHFHTSSQKTENILLLLCKETDKHMHIVYNILVLLLLQRWIPSFIADGRQKLTCRWYFESSVLSNIDR